MAGLRFGLIGTGFIGRAHAIALKAVGTVFGIEAPVCELLADTTTDSAAQAARALGFRRSTGDWQALVADPQVDVVDICTPNHLHREMALAAIRAGKSVYCEKPLANTAGEALEIVQAAEAAGVRNHVGFNYIRNPMVRHARELIRQGGIGDVCGFRGYYLEDYMRDPATPWSWRCQRSLAGAGALADLGSHLINAVHFLLEPVARVQGKLQTVYPVRPDPRDGRPRPVENEDVARALFETGSGIPGTFEISRIAGGYKCGLGFAVFGTRGTLTFDQERMNELRLYTDGSPPGERGFRTLLAGPEHPDYAAFCPAPGHGLGINDLKVIEARDVLRSFAGEGDPWPDFREGYRVQRVMEAIEQSHAAGGWVSVPA
ncbi:MAG: Gfo/Idh/MocA family oxidoreductase [Gammaproteobacteria bacterium]|nr:Gfo/Idh/MocA family oxidoreductase [Gammaproteobacteria bacterium]